MAVQNRHKNNYYFHPNGETRNWKGEIGFVTSIVEKVKPESNNCTAIVCGPPIMIKFTMPVLEKLGFTYESIIATLENRIKCGIGKCGRCNIGSTYSSRWDSFKSINRTASISSL